MGPENVPRQLNDASLLYDISAKVNRDIGGERRATALISCEEPHAIAGTIRVPIVLPCEAAQKCAVEPFAGRGEQEHVDRASLFLRGLSKIA